MSVITCTPVGRGRGQEREHQRKHYEVRERDAGVEQHDAGDHQRDGEAFFALVQAGRDERPHLVQHVRHRDEQRDEQRQLQRRHERRDQAGRDHRGAVRHLVDQRRRDEREQLVRRTRRRERRQTRSRSRRAAAVAAIRPGARSACLRPAVRDLDLRHSWRGLLSAASSAATAAIGGGIRGGLSVPGVPARRRKPSHRDRARAPAAVGVLGVSCVQRAGRRRGWRRCVARAASGSFLPS